MVASRCKERGMWSSKNCSASMIVGSEMTCRSSKTSRIGPESALMMSLTRTPMSRSSSFPILGTLDNSAWTFGMLPANCRCIAAPRMWAKWEASLSRWSRVTHTTGCSFRLRANAAASVVLPQPAGAAKRVKRLDKTAFCNWVSK